MALTPAERKELDGLMEEQRAIEAKRAETVEVGELQRKAIGENIMEAAADVPRALMSGASLGWHEEIMGAGKALWKKATGSDKGFKELYDKYRDEERAAIAEGRERSPIATFIAEMASGGAVAGGGGLAKTAMSGLAIGAGESTEEDIEDIAVDAALTGAGGTVLHGAGKLLKAPFKDPKRIRARFSGQKAKQFEKVGRLGDPEEMAKELSDARFYKYRNSDFDLSTGKFKPVGKRSRGVPSREESITNINRSQKTIAKEVDRVIEKTGQNKLFTAQDLDEHIRDSVDDLYDEAIDEVHLGEVIEKELSKLMNSVNRGGEGVSLTRLNKIKKNWQNASKKSFESSVSDPVFKDKSEVQEAISRGLRTFVEDNAGQSGDAIRKLNRVSHQLFNAKKGISQSVAASKAGGLDASIVNPYANALFQATKLGEKAGGGESGMLYRASIGEAAESIPSVITDPLQTGVKEFGKRGTQRMLIDDSSGREPQSVPEQVIRTPLPRNSDEIMEQKEFVLMKTAQMAPELFDNLKDVLENNPEDIPELLPVLAQVAPHLFGKDKYSRIDGVIMDPELKMKATKDTMDRDDLSNHDKIKMINELNKTGVFYDN